ncbi:hypothetical protein GGR28_003090 [Lewinella aquimaris]|uniref:Uncharacterized protein n=1 Tax=Neolewinella aquimaris TaxID=1835722 RepID=A0A840EHT1_9BACT|nr:hypothetical protein [Neolewinella aquimaris]MBB4080456.1 hypothetical protein [Neolewinella aquimaris]
MTLRSLVVVFLFVSCAASRSQTPIGVADFFIDPMGKAYFLLDDDRLVTGNQLGANTYSFYDSSLGSPDYVDVANPFQILVYYRAYGTVLVLDRTLSELDRIDLFANQHIRQPGAIARSYDNGIWVFDNWNYRLLRLNERGEPDQQTNNLRLQLGEDSEPAAIFVDRTTVMLYFRESSRLAVFTNYGEFRGWVAVPPHSRLSWNAPYLLGIKDDGTVWNYTSGQTQTIPLGSLPAALTGMSKVMAGPTGYLSVGPGELLVTTTEFPEKN